MKNVVLSAAAAVSLIALPQIAQAQTAGPVVPGLAVANLDAVIANSSAFRTAETQRQTTYKSQIDAAEARRRAISAQLQPLADKFNRDRQAHVSTATLQQEAGTIQQIQSSGEQELQRMMQPVALSEAYVEEQVTDKLQTAVTNAMNKYKITLLLAPNSVVSANTAYNLNQAILNELNTLIPSAQLVPPAGWQPRQVREQQAQQAAQQPAAAQPAGR